MRSARGFLFVHMGAGVGATFAIAGERLEADAVYVSLFDVDEHVDACASCEDDFLGEAVVYFPDDVDLPEADIDDEDDGFALVRGPHTADEWRLDHGMLVCPCEVCSSCRGWLVHMTGCADATRSLPPSECCEQLVSCEEFPLEIEWVPGDRRPVRFASGWKHSRFHEGAHSLVVVRVSR
jgi:hypothetical protein